MKPLIVLLCLSLIQMSVSAQARGAGNAPQAIVPKAGAPFDITGYWVSLVTEDWRWRMFPAKGDYGAIPLNALGRRIADMWDPARDEAAGEQCKGYGGAAIMRVPGRFHITWHDDQTLKIETDAGMQTRLLYFGDPLGDGGDWQGVSRAEWEFAPFAGGFVGAAAAANPPPNRTGSLKVVTTKLKPGYLLRNGVPYSASTTVTEYYDLIRESNGDTYLILTMTVEDPTYLNQPMFTTAHFRKQADNTGWNPLPCSSRP
jgi:hypothetical protein